MQVQIFRFPADTLADVFADMLAEVWLNSQRLPAAQTCLPLPFVRWFPGRQVQLHVQPKALHDSSPQGLTLTKQASAPHDILHENCQSRLQYNLMWP